MFKLQVRYTTLDRSKMSVTVGLLLNGVQRT